MLNPQAYPYTYRLRPLTLCYQPSPPPPFLGFYRDYYSPSPYYATYYFYPPPSSPLLLPPPHPFSVEPTVQISELLSSEDGGGGGGESGDSSQQLEALVEKSTEEYTPPPPLPRCGPLRDLRRLRRKTGWVWLPRSSTTDCISGRRRGNVDNMLLHTKHSFLPKLTFSSSSSSSPSLEFDESHRQEEQRTTVMIRNIPNKLSRAMLLKLLDEHCVKENEKDLPEGSPLSEYDFVYLPIDFRNLCNLGYAFVNFTTATAAWRAYESLHGWKWDVFSSSKITHVCYARIQGKAALLEHFRRSWFQCDKDEYLPAVLSPPRDGATSRPDPSAVGKRANE